MKNLVNGSNFARYSDFIFSEIVSKEEFDFIRKKNNNLIIVNEYNYLKLHAIWYINPVIELKDNDVIFSHSEVVDILFKLLKKFSQLKNLKLITHQSDRAIDKRLFNKKPKNVSSWYSPNINLKSDGLFSIPIGVNNFYNENFFNKKIQNNFFLNRINEEKKEVVYVNFTLDTNQKHRKKALEHAKLLPDKNKFIDTSNDSFNYFENISKSKFTLAPWGNGIDTHRFWEALYLGSIPVTMKHTHFEEFSELPAIFLNNYSELTTDNLKKQNQNFEPNDIEILDINYWLKIIKSEKIEKKDFKKINFVNYLNMKIKYFKLKIKIKSQKKIITYYIKKYLNLKNYYRIFVN
jgi:hypothetical protein